MKYFLIILLCLPIWSFSQDALLSEIDTDSIIDKEAIAVFKGLKIVNFESTKLISKKQFLFMLFSRYIRRIHAKHEINFK